MTTVDLDRHAPRIAIIVAALLALVRLPLLWYMHAPGIIWDEMTYLSMARFLAGAGPATDFTFDPNVEHAGYAVALIPAFLAHPPFAIAYHLVLGTNLILGACMTWLIYAVARRVAGAPWQIALLCAIALTLYPSIFALPLFVFTENVVFPAFLLSVLAFHEIARNERSVVWHLMFTLAILSAWFAHAAAIVLVLSAAVALAWIGASRRRSLPYVATDVLLFSAGFALVAAAHHQLWAISWGPKGDASQLQSLPQLGVGPLLAAAVELLRALCYQQAATVLPTIGISVVAIGALVQDVVQHRRHLSARATTCVYVLIAVAGSAIMSAFFITTIPNWRPQLDLAFTTRYSDEGMLAAMALGVPLIFSSRIPRAIYLLAALAIGILAIVAVPIYNGATYTQLGESINELAWAAYACAFGGAPVLVLGVLALLLLAVVAWLRRRAPRLGLIALALLWLGIDWPEIHGPIHAQQNSVATVLRATVARLVPYVGLLPASDSIAYDASNMNVLTYNILALGDTEHHIRSVVWQQGSAPSSEAAIAPALDAPHNYTKVECETNPPFECLYVRSPHVAASLNLLAGPGRRQ